MTETGTSRELNVQPGDVVALLDDRDEEHFTCIACPPRNTDSFRDHWEFETALFRDEPVRIISRAKPTPDLTAITTPYGLLDEVYGPGTQAALRAHGGPYEFFSMAGKWENPAYGRPAWFVHQTYRVKPTPPAPKVETVTAGWNTAYGFFGHDPEGPGKNTHRITFDTRDGEPDCNTIRMVKL